MNALAVFALAFTLVGSEQSYGPYSRPGDGDEHAIATAKSGALLVWSERANGNTQIHVALLNESARLISPISVLPLVQPGEAIAPAVVSNGTTFLIAYFERGRDQRLYTIEVDAAGLPIGAPRAIGTPTPPSLRPPVRLDWNGSAFRINPPPAATALVMNVPVYGPPCHAGPFGCFQGWTNAIVWTAGTSNGQRILGNHPTSPTAIAATGEQFVVAWGTWKSVGYLLTGGGEGGIWAEPEVTAAPGVACDSTRCVVAYATLTGDVHAIVFPPARPMEQELLAIATSEREEREVQVDALREGRFLVTYRSTQGTDHRIAGRVVTFDPPKQRAARR